MDSCISFVVTSEKMLSSFDMTNIVVVDNQILVRGTCTIDSRIYLCTCVCIADRTATAHRYIYIYVVFDTHVSTIRHDCL